MLASMEKGGIDAAVLTIPSMFVAEDRGYRVLLDMADTDIYYLHTMIATTRSYIKNNRDKVSRFLKGFLEGIAFVKQHKKESIDIVKKKLRIGNITRRRPIPRCAALRRSLGLSRRTIRRQRAPIQNHLSTTVCCVKSIRAALSKNFTSVS